MNNFKNETETILENVYDTKSAADVSEYIIKSNNVRHNKVVYLDEEVKETNEEYKPQDDEHINVAETLNGGALNETIKTDIKLYQSLADIPDDKIKRFIDKCKLSYIVSNAKPNSIFIIPDDSSYKEICDNIEKTLGNTKEDTPEGVSKIKTGQNLLYKQFIIDVYGENKTNEGYQYRINPEYPEKLNDNIIRRTSRSGDVFFIKTTKTGIEISTNSNMNNSVTCKLLARFGKAPNYISYAFFGTVPSKKSGKMTGGGLTVENITNVNLFRKRQFENKNDKDFGAYMFVADMIKNHGINECLDYYSADMVHTAINMLNKFGRNNTCEKICSNACDAETQHMKLLSNYKPIKNTLTRDVISQVRAFNNKVLNNLNAITPTRYLNEVNNFYKNNMNKAYKKDSLAMDIATNIYNDTGSIDTALSMYDTVNDTLSDKFQGGGFNNNNELSTFEFKHVLNVLNDKPLCGMNAKQYYPTLYNTETYARKHKKTNKKKNETDNENIEYEEENINEIDMDFLNDI